MRTDGSDTVRSTPFVSFTSSRRPVASPTSPTTQRQAGTPAPRATCAPATAHNTESERARRRTPACTAAGKTRHAAEEGVEGWTQRRQRVTLGMLRQCATGSPDPQPTCPAAHSARCPYLRTALRVRPPLRACAHVRLSANSYLGRRRPPPYCQHASGNVTATSPSD